MSYLKKEHVLFCLRNGRTYSYYILALSEGKIFNQRFQFLNSLDPQSAKKYKTCYIVSTCKIHYFTNYKDVKLVDVMNTFNRLKRNLKFNTIFSNIKASYLY